ncbi:MAG: 50S ribosomal protein L22 [Phycisphaerae bacterium]|nr:50S ribosomal protein L22 [Phycisphaerae bacterium]
MSVDNLAGHVARGGLSRKDAASAIRNWKRRLYKPLPTATDVEHLAGGLGVEAVEISEWRVSYRYAPTAPRKARLVADMIAGLPAQKALDVLKFEHKRAARMIEKLLQSAIANADEAEADVERLIVSEARVDGAGRRLGTKGWIAKDRGRAHPIRKEASHLHVTVTEE